MEQVSIMIIEDEVVLAEDLAARLRIAGYHVAAIVDNGADALALYERLLPDVVMADIHLKGAMDGIQVVAQFNRVQHHASVIYLTAYSDNKTWERAKETNPAAYLTKPFREREINSAIELAMSRKKAVGGHSLWMHDRCFIRSGNGRFEKLMFEELLYLEAARSYCDIVTRDRRIVLSESLNQLYEKMANDRLIRIHRSYAVNIGAIESIEQRTVVVGGEVLPIGDTYAPIFFQRMNIIH